MDSNTPGPFPSIAVQTVAEKVHTSDSRVTIPRPMVYRPYFMSFLIGFFCLTITLLSFVLIRDRESTSDKMEFDRRANSYASALQRQIDLDLEIVRSIASLYAASDRVSRAEFRQFVEQTLRQHPEIQALEWIPRVRSWERALYEERARNQGIDGFRITQQDESGHMVRADEGREYFPVYFLEPVAGNERALGFDLGSEPSRLATLKKARDAGLPETTAPIKLVQEQGVQNGVLVFYPIYRMEKLNETVEGRRNAHLGYALGVFRMGDVVELAIQGVASESIHPRLLDVTDPSGELVLFDPDSGKSENEARGNRSTPGTSIPINVPGRRWILQITKTSSTFELQDFRFSWGVLLSGGLLTILLTAYLVNRSRHALGMEALEGDLSKTSLQLQRRLAERQSTTEALLKSEARFGAVFEHGQFAMAVSDPKGYLLDTNPAFQRLLGYSADELHMIHFRDLTLEEDLAESLLLFQQIINGEKSQFEVEKRYVRKNGEIIWCHTGVSAICNEAGDVEATIPMLVDITSRKIAEMDRENLQHQLVHTQKMEAIGRLAGGIAHDFNNLLTVLRGYTSLSLEEISPDDTVSGYLTEIEKTTDRAEILTRQLLAFGRKQLLQPRVLYVNDVIANMGEMLRRLIGEDVELVADLSPDIMKVRIDVGQIEQVVMNLAVNARDAMPAGGRLVIETRNVDVSEITDASGSDIPRGRYVALVVRDNGEGMDPETLEKIFEPFFTTKEVGAGTGLGLATVYGVLTQSGGHIHVESEVGKGTVFTILLPVTDASPHDFPEVEDPIQGSTGEETILLVEDETMVRRVARDALVSFGYKVLEAGSGIEALSLCQEYQGEIHLILTDVIMPGMNGPEFVKRIRPDRPGAKVIYMSGYTGDGVSRKGLPKDGDSFLAKPFRPAVLGEKVRGVLDSKD